MIVSLGGSPEPVTYSIEYHRPDVVCFLASQETIELVPQVKERLDYQLTDRKVLVQDPNSLLACFKDALECWDMLVQQNVAAEDVLIDFTGGTKVMSAALVLLGIQKGCPFSYIGGSERTKGGVGTVVTGNERVFEGANPWEALAIAEERQAISDFNQFRFSAACATFKDAQAKVQHNNRRLCALFSRLANLSEAYQLWEAFRHREAHRCLREVFDGLTSYAGIASDQRVATLVEQVKDNLAFLNRMAEQSKGFKEPCRTYILDLIANGQRRAGVASFDDAVLRLYRALEIQGQVQLQSGYGIDTGKVQPEKVPESLRSDFVRRYAAKDGGLKLPLEASYLLLGALADPLGERFQEMQGEFRKVQSARNSSWLAHGTNIVGEDTYNRLHQLALSLCEVAAEELPRFPKLLWPVGVAR